MRKHIDYAWYRFIALLADITHNKRLSAYATDLFERGYERHVQGI